LILSSFPVVAIASSALGALQREGLPRRGAASLLEHGANR
jgi:hypothetical protein